MGNNWVTKKGRKWHKVCAELLCDNKFVARAGHSIRCKSCQEKRTKKMKAERERAWAKTKRKGKYKDTACIDCGQVFFWYKGRKRCDPCIKKHAKKYGEQYRAVHRKENPTPWKFKKIKRQCPDCGNNFIADPRRPRCKKCGEARKKEWDKRSWKKYKSKPLSDAQKKKEKFCVVCGEKYMGISISKYCSSECKKIVDQPRRNAVAREFSKTDRGKSKGLLKAWHRRALMYDAYLPDSCDDEMAQFDELQRKATKLSGIQHHVDHIIPLFIGGAHHQDNLRVITIHENSSKRITYDPSLGGVWADNELAKEYKPIFKLHGAAYKTKRKTNK